MSQILWIIGTCVLGFSISAYFSDCLKLKRELFLIPYIGILTIFICVYAYLNIKNLNIILLHNWYWGLVAGIIVSLLMFKNISMQPVSRKSKGLRLIFEIIWFGVVYGIIDALFLNVFPVISITIIANTIASNTILSIGMIKGIIALAVSLIITLAYHWGYSEFRNKSIGLVLLGNAIITAAYIISGNPLGAIIGHTAMHIAAVIHGPDTTIQLPPHKAKI